MLGDADALGDVLADALLDGLCDEDGLTLAETDALGLFDGETLGETDALGLFDELGLTDGETLGLGPVSLNAAPTAPQSSEFWVQVMSCEPELVCSRY